MFTESRFIIHTETTPMDVGDPTMASAPVEGVLSHGLAPGKVLGDTQYGSGKSGALAKRRRVQVSAPLFLKARSASRIKQGFIYAPLAETVTCPAGKIATSKWYSADGEVVVCKFSPKMCKRRPRAEDCIGEKSSF